ncbi:Bug family tripartite tricarboxylate transporter substrate binding protein [Roseomonas populi]|uniref:Tripartite tricarboxylate transporter substrate binding protein n=1 Tax=Roseomonas populi TaxID=3121582 RepID=A0ABT1WZB7_9PROT|nr:tripartite tricarboxylate transporter substrate binding protein [Roseomonas pecuniae]MCR0981190.1 tripartite tricarboxylate transporter substrate binding protein [Roseomonas pecuniae]
MRRREAVVALATLTLAARAQAQVQGSRRPGQMIIPFAAGASADGVARVVAAGLGPRLDRNFVADNRPGAGGTLGLSVLARSPADGSVLGTGATGAVVINPHTPDGQSFEPLRQLAPVARIADIPLVIIAGSGTGLKTLQDVVARSKSDRAGLSYGTTGTNSAQHLAMVTLAQATGANLIHVPYRGSAPAVTDVLAGTLPLASVDLTSAQAHIQAGTVVPLAVTGPQRSKLAPSVPTVAEAAVPGYSVTAWMGLFGPAGLPEAMREQISRATSEVVADPETERALLSVSAEPSFLDHADFARFLADESARWKRVLGTMGKVE